MQGGFVQCAGRSILSVQMMTFFHSRTTAEELVAALQLRRFSRVNSSNFRIKNSPQLARSDVSICI